MTDQEMSEAKVRVLEMAELLFRAKGFAAVTMRDIAQALGMQKPSLYYHTPGGKEQLFQEVIERVMTRYQHGITEAIASGHDLRTQLTAIALWALSQPQLNISRLFQMDFPQLEEAKAHPLVKQTNYAVFHPVEQIIAAASARGDIRPVDEHMVAVLFINALESLYELARYMGKDKQIMAESAVTLFMDGLRPI
ncbi:MAG: TetR/AcrR family transcriptional regulator [Anaerolineae bacterium]